MNKLKLLLIYLVNMLIGFFSMRYVLIGIEVAINIKQGPGYNNPEGESLKIIGYIMLFFWISIISMINIILIKVFIGNVKENLRLVYKQRFQWKNFLHYVVVVVSLLFGGVLRFIVLINNYNV